VSELDLLVVGDINADLVLRGGDLVPAFGQREQLVDSASLVLGGSAAIVAAGAARLGLRVAIAGCVGDDVPRTGDARGAGRRRRQRGPARG
jgi:sugar/nucleoside kinase (ribokinase family)